MCVAWMGVEAEGRVEPVRSIVSMKSCKSLEWKRRTSIRVDAERNVQADDGCVCLVCPFCCRD